MISIKYTEAVSCIYSDYGCGDAACSLNKLHEPKETHFAITDIEPPGSIKIMNVLLDESIDSFIRDWIKTTHVEGKRHPVPQAIRDIGEGKKPKILTPLERWMRGANVAVGPVVVILDDRKKP